ncbi:hypothetical protein DFH28DRAFT_922796 [Melampsora americana]|nr:hypothetical protein DFH28DRAFT_922796 [Melampsora americana]
MDLSMADATSPAPTSTAAPLSENLSAIIEDALKQQASQFEAIIGDLKTQVSNLNVTKKTPKAKTPDPPSSTSSQRFATPTARKVSNRASSLKFPKTPRTPRTPTPI